MFNSVKTFEQIEAMFLDAVAKARGNLSSAAPMLGVTRPPLASRLKRLREGAQLNLQTLAEP